MSNFFFQMKQFDGRMNLVDRDEELWTMALGVGKRQGSNGWFYVTQQQDCLLAQDQDEGARIWRQVGEIAFGRAERPLEG